MLTDEDEKLIRKIIREEIRNSLRLNLAYFQNLLASNDIKETKYFEFGKAALDKYVDDGNFDMFLDLNSIIAAKENITENDWKSLEEEFLNKYKDYIIN